MDNFVIFTSHSAWTYGLLNTLISRGFVPRGIVFEGPIRDTLLLRCMRILETFFLWAEHTVLFRRHGDPHQCYRRYGSVTALLNAHNVVCHHTKDLNSEDTEAFLRKIQPQYILLCGTRIIKSHILAIPTKGTLNAHSAMLPFYRGSKSEYWLLSQKEYEKAGVTVHWVDEHLDTGAICLQEKIHVSKYETTKTLRAKAIYLGAHLFAETLRRLQAGEDLRTSQVGGSLYKRPSPDAVQQFDAGVIQSRR